MMMLSQCVTFGMMSENFWNAWTDPGRKDPPSVSTCDWQEVGDMLDFQALMAKIKVNDDGVPDLRSLSEDTDKMMPLSPLISAHHNLVTYGVPFSYSNRKVVVPGPNKAFYDPYEAIKGLAASLDKIDGQEQDGQERGKIGQWVETNRNELDRDEDYPGMKKWVARMLGKGKHLPPSP